MTTILEGESLVNDTSALIAYRLSIAAIGTGSFVYWQAGLNVVVIGFGGITAGLAIGYVVIFIQKRFLNNSISTSLTLIAPFIAYLTAERLHTSGVLAVVTTGLMMSWRASEIYSYQTRIRNKAVWDTVIFLLNGFVFILIEFSDFLKAQPEIQKFERKLLLQLHKDGSFTQPAIRRIEQELDLAELQLKTHS